MLEELLALGNGIVEELAMVLPRHALPHLVELLHRVVRIRGHEQVLAVLLLRVATADLADQHGVVRGEGATRLRDERRHGDVLGLADLVDDVDDVVGVLRDGVVHARLVRRVAPVVVDAETTTHVEILDRVTVGAQLRVDARTFADGILDAADLGDLAARMEVQQAELILEPVARQHVERVQQLLRREAELRLRATRAFPHAGTARQQTRPGTDQGLNAHPLGHASDEFGLVRLLDDEEHVAPELAPPQRELHVRLVLVAVADDHGLFADVVRERDRQLGLAARLEADAARATGIDQRRDDVGVLVHLDRIHAAVHTVIVELADRAVEGIEQLVHAVGEDLREPHQQREAQLASLDAIDERMQIDPAPVAIGMHGQVAAAVDAEVALPPVVDAVVAARIAARVGHDRTSSAASGRSPWRGGDHTAGRAGGPYGIPTERRAPSASARGCPTASTGGTCAPDPALRP